MAPTSEAARAVGADLGIVLDTDVDRSGVVDKNGEAINRNRLIAFLATVVLRDSPGTTIVTDSTTSNGLAVGPLFCSYMIVNRCHECPRHKIKLGRCYLKSVVGSIFYCLLYEGVELELGARIENAAVPAAVP